MNPMFCRCYEREGILCDRCDEYERENRDDGTWEERCDADERFVRAEIERLEWLGRAA